MRISKALFNKYADGRPNYVDIGHNKHHGDVFLWVFDQKTQDIMVEKIEADEAAYETHLDIFPLPLGNAPIAGRFVPGTNTISFHADSAAFVSELSFRASVRMAVEKLKDKFGPDIKFEYFADATRVMEGMKNIKALLNKYAYGGDGDGKMVAIYPSEKSRNQLKAFTDKLDLSNVKDILKPEEYHTTIRYWKGEEELTDQVIEMLEDNIKVTEEIGLKPQGFELFGDENCLVIELEADKDIKSLFGYIDDKLQSIGIPPSDYDTFRPHITLAVGVEKKPDIMPDFEIIFNRLALVKNDKTLWESSK